MFRNSLNKLVLIVGLIIFSVLALNLVAGEDQDNYSLPLDKVGTEFSIPSNPHWPDLKITSSEKIHLVLWAITDTVCFYLEPATTKTETTITFSGLKPSCPAPDKSITLYRYEDAHFQEEFQPDAEGKYTYTQDILKPHFISISQEKITSSNPATKNPGGSVAVVMGTGQGSPCAEPVTIPITLYNPGGIRIWLLGIRFTYDPNVLELISWSNGTLTSHDPEVGVGVLGFVWPYEPIAGKIAELVFKIRATAPPGFTPIGIPLFLLIGRIDDERIIIQSPGNTGGIEILVCDTTPPVTQATISPPPNAAGWNKTDLTVTLTATDPEPNPSGVKGIYYRIGAQDEVGVSVATVDIPITAEGVHTLQFYAVDNADNVEETKEITVRLDKTPPVITSAQDPPANEYGWNKTGVTVSFSATDILSGIATISESVLLTAEGAGQKVTGIATDKAGNSASITVTVNIDKTPPIITSVQDPSPNQYGWNNTDVTVSFKATDYLSGIAWLPGPVTLSAEGSGQKVTGIATDKAGNSAATTAIVNIDKTSPVITSAQDPPPNEYGWNNTDVTVSFIATDALSGIDTITDPVTLTTDGADQKVEGTAMDKAGNSVSTTASVNIDKTPPVITSVQNPLPTKYGWNNTDVTVSFSATDALSGIATISESVLLTKEGAGQKVTGIATDNAGNSASITVTVNIDKTPPIISYTQNPLPNQYGWNNTDVTVSFTAIDYLSGIATITDPVTLTTDGADQKVEGTSTDKAGNSVSTTASVNIDKTPPVITSVQDPLPTKYGWNKTNVTVSFSATDALSGIATISESVLLTAEGAGQKATGTATDNAGNSASITVTVNIDKTPPIITPVQNPSPNQYGWNNTNVTVSFKATDYLSGIASITEPVTLTTDGADQKVEGTATDKAGNSATKSVIVNIDKTPPIITSVQNPPPNEYGWNNTPVTVSFQATDELSDIAEITDPVTLTTEGKGQKVTGKATDKAGNSASITVTVNIDWTKPMTQATIDPEPKEGWNNKDVTVTLKAIDPSQEPSGVREIHYKIGVQGEVVVSGATAEIYITVEGIHTIQFYAVDNADNVEETKEITVRIDWTKPIINVISLEPDKPAYKTLTLDFRLTDESEEPSGIKSAKASIVILWDSIPVPVPPEIELKVVEGQLGESVVRFRGDVDIRDLVSDREYTVFCDIYGKDLADNEAFLRHKKPLEIRRPEKEIKGQPKPDTGVGDVINVTNGNMYFSVSDLFMPSRGIPLSFIRAYNSRDTYSGPLGYGWTHSYNINLTERPDGSVIEMDEDGAEITFLRRPDGTYAPPKGEYSKLEKTETGFTLTRKHGTKYTFIPSSLLSTTYYLLSITDRNGNIQTLTYSPPEESSGSSGQGAEPCNLTQITDTSGRIIDLIYGAQGRIYTIIDPVRRRIKYRYDADGNLKAVMDQAGNVTRYTYDADHNLILITDARGNHTYFTYNEDDRAIETKNDGDNNKITLSYDPDNMRTTVTDARGNTTTYTYNEDGVCTEITDALENTTTYTWDENINRTSSTDANGHTTAFEYDEMGNLTATIDPLNNTTRFTYEPTYNLVTSITDPLIHLTEYVYDEKGNLVQVTDTLGNITWYEYGQFGNLISLTDAEGHQTTYGYDIYGNLTVITDPLNNQTQFAYDILGNSTRMTNAKENITSYTYDDLNRLTQITYPDGTKVTYTYDEVGNRTSVTDPNNHTTYFAYDVVNRLISVTDALGNITTYTYDLVGNRTAITDANNHTTTYIYDEVNRLIKTVTPLGKETIYAYDPVGNRTSTTDANGHTINYTYDVCNRLTQITYPDSSTVEFSYDTTGKRISMRDTIGLTTYTYDEINRLTSVDGPEVRDTISYTYDKVGNRVSMTNQDGGITTYEYDQLNRLTKIIDPSGKVTTYSYDEVSNLTDMVYPNNTQTTYQQDVLNRLTKLTNQGAEGVISSYAYDYDAAGMRTKVTLVDCHSERSEESRDYIEYDYNEVNMLVSEVKKKWNGHKVYYSYAYQFDPVGNRTSLIKDLHQEPVFAQGEPKGGKGKDKGKPDEKTKPTFWDLPGHSDFAYEYNAENQLTQVRITREETTFIADYQYDNNGNLISKKEYKQCEPQKAEVTLYFYDFENRLTKIVYPDGTTSEYRYNGVGVRIQSIENGEITKYLHDGLNVIIERDELDNTLVTYTRGLSYGGGIGGIISAERAQLIRYYHYDGLGTVTGLTDLQGSLIQSYQYDAFGNLLSSTGSEINPYQFSTKEYSSESGFSYFGNRYYNARVGAFITKDPYQLADLDFPPHLHKYLYCFNNPVNFLDPWGLVPIEIPPHPPSVDIKKNIERARTMTRVDFYFFVRDQGPWDYKQWDSKYENFGNFNYGATGRAVSFSRQVLLRMAGLVQGKRKPEWGKPWGSAPYGDEPHDHEMIKKGMDYYDEGLWKK